MKRESFKSRLGFLLVSAGCAIGIGNVWRFPYVAGQNGGGIFVLFYLIFLIAMGLPVLTMEFAVGRASRKSAVLGYKALEKEGISVKILDVRGSTELVLRRAGKLFGEEKQAERIIRERTERLAALDDVRKSIRKGQKAAIFLAIRSPVRHESYVFRISERSALSQLLTNTFAIENINVRPNAEERIPGIQELDDLSDLFEKNPDLIVYTGDAAACGQKTAEFIRKHPQFAECNAVKNGRIYGAPYYCHALDLRRHEILEAWSDVLAD